MKKFLLILLILLVLPVVIFAKSSNFPDLNDIFTVKDHWVNTVCGMPVPGDPYNLDYEGTVSAQFNELGWGPIIKLNEKVYANGFFDSIEIMPNAIAYWGDSEFYKYYSKKEKRKANDDYEYLLKLIKQTGLYYFEQHSEIMPGWNHVLFSNRPDLMGNPLSIDLHENDDGYTLNLSIHNANYYNYAMNYHITNYYGIPYYEKDLKDFYYAEAGENLFGRQYRILPITPDCRFQHSIATYNSVLLWVISYSESLTTYEDLKEVWDSIITTFDQIFANEKLYNKTEMFDFQLSENIFEIHSKLKEHKLYRIDYGTNEDVSEESYGTSLYDRPLNIISATIHMVAGDSGIKIAVVLTPQIQ